MKEEVLVNFADRMKEVIRKNFITNNFFPGPVSDEKNIFEKNINLLQEIHELIKCLEIEVFPLGYKAQIQLIKKKPNTLRKNTEVIRALLLEIGQ